MSSTSPSRLFSEVPFETDGKHTGFIRLFNSVHESAFGFIPIPIVVVRNGEGPTALLVSGNHGDEYEGQVALCNLARGLSPDRISGRVIITPMANFPAGKAGLRTSPIDGGNLNRAFPGDPSGSVTEQIAYFYETVLVPMSDYICDLHSGGSSLMYVPSTLTVRPSDPAKLGPLLGMLKAFGAPYGYVSAGGNGTGGESSLWGAAERCGKLAINTELGGAGSVHAGGLRIGCRGINNLLVHAGILPQEDFIPVDRPTRLLELKGPDYYVYATEDGIFEPLVEPGDEVISGQAAGRIHSPETPWLEPTISYFQREGIVMCKRIPGRTKRGDCLFHLASELPSGA
ncbi:deacylase [Paracoccus sp. S-4012]|nr:deacylase [Paracoccus sp. S-4012]